MANTGLIIGVVVVGLLVITGIVVAIVFIVKGNKKTTPTTVPGNNKITQTVAPRPSSAPAGSGTLAPTGSGTSVPGGSGTSVTNAPTTTTTTPPPITPAPATSRPTTQPPIWTVAPTQAPTYDRNVTCSGYEWALGVSTNLIYVRKVGDPQWRQIPGEAVKLYTIAGQILALNASGGLYAMSCVPPGDWALKLTNVKSVDTNYFPTSTKAYFTVTYLDNTTGRVYMDACVPYMTNSCSTISW